MPELVQGLGALAGLAAVVGLIGLAALHLSQARDVERLRNWAAGRISKAASSTGSRSVTRPGYALVGLLVLVCVTGITRLTGDDGGDDRAVIKPKRKVAAIKPANVTVAVLNGTTVDGLAARLRDHIAAAGFRRGTIDVFSDQQLAESVVQYAPGRQAEAKAVGRRVGISQREPVTANSRALAGDATVIVIAGADKAP